MGYAFVGVPFNAFRVCAKVAQLSADSIRVDVICAGPGKVIKHTVHLIFGPRQVMTNDLPNESLP